jgi:hypothetical protein
MGIRAFDMGNGQDCEDRHFTPGAGGGAGGSVVEHALDAGFAAVHA